MMFQYNPAPHTVSNTHRTSKLWFLGFGMKIITLPQSVHLKKGHRSITVNVNDIAGVHTERRFFRGHTLIVNIQYGKPLRFRMTKRQAQKAQLLIASHVAHKKD